MPVKFDLGPLETGLNTFTPRVELLVSAVVDRQADVAESWMKQNAPWTDRTGNARSGLATKPGRSGTSWVIDLFGRVPYQIWLEVRWAGRYAIIVPALQNQGAALMRNLEGLFSRLRGL